MAWSREQLAERAAGELPMVSTSISASEFRPCGELHPQRDDRVLQSENGMLGMGPFPYEGEEDPT